MGHTPEETESATIAPDPRRYSSCHPPSPTCGINNVGSISSVLGPTVAEQLSEFYRRRGQEERTFVEGHPMGSRVVPTTATPGPW